MATANSRVKISNNHVIEDRAITALEASNKQMTLAATPKDTNKVSMDIPQGPIQRNGFDFAVSTNILTWDGYALETIMEENDRVIIEYFIY